MARPVALQRTILTCGDNLSALDDLLHGKFKV
jgi:hypothetical protein